MYRYYQKAEGLSWVPVPDKNGVEEAALSQGARKLTILAVSEIIDDEVTKKDQLSYKGPLYFDIDNKDLSDAITSASSLVSKLRGLDVPDEAIQVYASGSKGFHVMVPASVFSSGRAVKNLPLVYREMALDLHVIGMDFAVYGTGRGNSWRIVNLQREDGNYRVPITLQELERMTPEVYKEVTSAPRSVNQQDINGAKSLQLEALMGAAKKRVAARPKPAAPVPIAKLAQFQSEPPACVHALADYKVKNSTNFNQASLQLASFIARAGIKDDVADSLMSRMAENSSSAKYDTTMARQAHITGLAAYCMHNKAKTFACNAIRSVLQKRPCEECPINGANATGDDAAYEIGVVERPDGYYVIGKDGDYRISTFILEPIAVYIEPSQNGGVDRRVGTMVEVSREGETLGTFMLSEQCWDSKASFKAEFRGIHNFSYTGTDDDVQRIKHLVFAEGRDMGEIVQVHTAGMHTQRVGKRDLMVYVEPGFSINELRVQGTHVFSGKIPAPPELQTVSLPEIGDKGVTEALLALVDTNSKEITAQVLGWFVACHLKTQLMRRYTQFPLLMVWGNAGSGKSALTSLMARINGCDYTTGNSALNLSSVTSWAIIHYSSCTTTAPRLLEEYNKSKMRTNSYSFCGEIMKAAWNANVMGRGTIGGGSSSGRGRTGAEMVEIPISSPLVVVSEQAPQMAALQQRGIQVMLSSASRRGKTEAYKRASAMREDIGKLAKALMVTALTTKTEWVEAQMNGFEQYVPESFMDRPRFSYQVLLTGLSLLQKTCDDLKLQVGSAVSDLQEALISTLETRSDEISRAKNRTEVDAVIEDLGIMATLSAGGGFDWLISGKNFAVNGDRFFIDIPVAHAMYKLYKRNSKDAVVIDSLQQFKQLLSQEPYFVTDKALLPEMVQQRPVFELDAEQLRNKGIDMSMFAG